MFAHTSFRFRQQLRLWPVVALAAAVIACGGGDGDAGGEGGAGGSPATSGAGGGPSGDPEPALDASCRPGEPACPASLECVFQRCTVAPCPSTGPGAEHGCPANGFCYFGESLPEGYCTRICETDDDCKAVNPGLFCRAFTSVDPYRLKICALQFG